MGYLPVLAQRARAANNRERANAIKALHRMKVGAATVQLHTMLRDTRPEHRISALWALLGLTVGRQHDRQATAPLPDGVAEA